MQIYQRDRTHVNYSKDDETSVADIFQELLFGKWSQVGNEMLRVGDEQLKYLMN